MSLTEGSGSESGFTGTWTPPPIPASIGQLLSSTLRVIVAPSLAISWH
jgi:hypothetical protein